jgi:hypothetical protein
MKLKKYPYKAQILVTKENIELLNAYRIAFNNKQFHSSSIIGKHIKIDPDQDFLHAERLGGKSRTLKLISDEEFKAFVIPNMKEKLKLFKV